MIYTLTCNPSLDYIIQVDPFQIGTIHKTQNEKILPGGKGINVSIVLANLGQTSTALGFVAGFVGQEILHRLQDHAFHTQFIPVQNGLSRINIKMRTQKEETEINGSGPLICLDELNQLFKQLDLIQDQDIFVLSGSIPSSLPSTLYEEIFLRFQGKQTKIVVDASQDLLRYTLKYHPFLIKPNHHELGELFGVSIHSKEEILYYAQRLQEEGAQNVLVSMAEQGAILIDANHQVHSSPSPKGNLVNSVGAGDSMVAGFLSGYLETQNYHKAFLKGICAGSASAFSEELCTDKEVRSLLATLNQ